MNVPPQEVIFSDKANTDMRSAKEKEIPRSAFFFENPLIHILLIFVFALIAYSNTFHFPFQFDDKINIVTNFKLRDLNNFWPPEGSRWLGFLTFALNYYFGGLDTTGYHIVNILIHILNATLVYWLVLLTFDTPFMKASSSGFMISDRTNRLTALFSALIFVTHPVQTQAVTYIIQRFASLATFFYLLAIVMYVKGRLQLKAGPDDKRRLRIQSLAFYFVFLVSALLAMKTKEISFTLPLMIILYEFSFFNTPRNSPDTTPLFRKIIYVLPLFALMLVIPLSFIEINKPEDVLNISPSALGTNIISQKDYLLTQFRVIVTYVRLLFLPVNQSFDYAYPVYSSFFDKAVLLSLLFHLIVLSVGIYLYYLSKSSWKPYRLVSFGILWFYITLSVESSFIPLTDVIFEHRVYLPGVGVIISVITALFYFADNRLGNSGHWKQFIILLLICVILTLTAATFLRNEVWQNELTLWQDTVRKNPNNARGYNMIGVYYTDNGYIDQAMSSFYTAILRKPDYAEAHVNLGNCYIRKGMLEEGLREFIIALNLHSLDAIDQASLYVSIGNYYLKKNLPNKAVEYFKLSLNTLADDASIYFNLGTAYQAMGINDKAAEYFAKAQQLSTRQ
jgi:Tfp pilus assembly protein PilF